MCRSVGELLRCIRHHARLSDPLEGHLLLALAKCGCFDDALFLSQQLPHLSVRSGAAVVCAYTDSGRPHEALLFFRCMQERGIPPSSYTTVSLLKACGILQDLHHGMLFHADAIAYGFLPNGIVDNTLVSMYGKCGALLEAEYVFHCSPEQDLVHWNAMLSAYVELGDAEKALRLYGRFQSKNVSSDRPTYVSMLRACSLLGQNAQSHSDDGETIDVPALEIGHLLHADICSNGFVHNIYVNCSLITMYGKFGAVSEAENVFMALIHHDVISCAALLSVYVEQGLGEMALLLYRQLLKEGLSPDNLTDSLALQGCRVILQNEDDVSQKGQELALLMGHALHAKAIIDGLEADTSFYTHLVNLYGSCGAVAEAFDAFYVLSEHDVATWNALLNANVTNGNGSIALHLFMQMQKDGAIPTQQTFMFGIQACALYAQSTESSAFEGQSTKVKALIIGRALHRDAEMRSFTSDLFICNMILNMYIKSGSFFEAEVLFANFPRRNAVSWCTMLSGYVDEIQPVTALYMYRQMETEGVVCTEWTLVMALQACICLAHIESSHEAVSQSGRTAAFEIGCALHADARMKGLTLSATLMKTLAYMYSTCGKVIESESMFPLLMACKNLFGSIILATYLVHNKPDKALSWYTQMPLEGEQADGIAMACAIQACTILAEECVTHVLNGVQARLVAVRIGRVLHADACRQGLMSDASVSTAIVSLYGKCGSMYELEDVVKRLPTPSSALWNAILSAYLAQSFGEEVIKVYHQTVKHNVYVDEVTFVNALQGSSMVGDARNCYQLHFDIVCTGFDQSLPVVTCLIHAYGGCACMVDSQEAFLVLSKASSIAWNACIAGHARDGNTSESLALFEELRLVFTKPFLLSFLVILLTCSHTGLLGHGLGYFISMSEDYDYVPEAKHYGIILDVLGRGGDFRRLDDLLGRLPVDRNSVIRLSLLGACFTHSNIELALEVLHDTVHFDEEVSTAHVLLSNVYAHVG